MFVCFSTVAGQRGAADAEPGNLFRLMTPDKKELLFKNTAVEVDQAGNGDGCCHMVRRKLSMP